MYRRCHHRRRTRWGLDRRVFVCTLGKARLCAICRDRMHYRGVVSGSIQDDRIVGSSRGGDRQSGAQGGRERGEKGTVPFRMTPCDEPFAPRVPSHAVGNDGNVLDGVLVGPLGKLREHSSNELIHATMKTRPDQNTCRSSYTPLRTGSSAWEWEKQCA